MKILAVTLYQPWAQMVAVGEKRIETRSWPTTHRGIIAIHAAQRHDKLLWSMYHHPTFKPRLEAHGYGESFSSLPFGQVVAVAELLGCLMVTKYNQPKSPELELGDYALGRYMWFLGKVIELKPGTVATGRQGLWTWRVPVELEATVKTLAPWGEFRREKEA